MKQLPKLLIFFSAGLLPATGFTFPELPFCPAGGPPGWFNYFNHKRDQNIRHRYPPYQSQYIYPFSYSQSANNSTYSGPYSYVPHPFTRGYIHQSPQDFRKNY